MPLLDNPAPKRHRLRNLSLGPILVVLGIVLTLLWILILAWFALHELVSVFG